MVVEQGEVEHLTLDIGAGHLHLDVVAETVASMGATAYEAEVFLVEVVVVVGKVAYGYESLTLVLLKFDIQSPLGYSGDDTIVNLSQTFAHEFHLFVFDGSTFGVGCNLFHI